MMIWLDRAGWSAGVVSLAAFSASALGADPMSSSLLLRQDAPAPAAEERTDPREPEGRPAFGKDGAWYFELHAGAGVSQDSIDYGSGVTFGTFLANKFEINFGATGWYFAQDGPNAGGGNPHVGFRYHFMPEDRFNVYLEAGIGLLFTSDDVPEEGTDVNFTPRAGAGTLWILGDTDLRLDVGLRWHHISNASVSGSDENPARDSIMIYVGLVIPF